MLMNTYKQFPVTFVKGEECYLIDEKGNRYLDFTAGIAVNALGYSHKKLKTALKNQVDELLHCSNLYYNDEQIKVAKKLVEKTGMKRAYFCNSGAEAVESGLKLARKYMYYKGKPNKNEIIAMQQSFHGRSFGTVTATGQEKYKKGFGPLLPGIKHVPYNDSKSLQEAVDENTGAILLEVVQGEGGIHKVEKEFIEEVQKICDAKDIVLIIDEVQTGVGRTGKFCGFMHYKVQPDIVCLAKGLGAGVPVGAIVVGKKLEEGFRPGDYASTFGGNPLVMSAVDVVLDEINEDFLQSVREKSLYFIKKLEELKKSFDFIEEVKGQGLMLGLKVSVNPRKIVEEAFKHKLLIVPAGSNVVRFVPPLVITIEDIDTCVDIMYNICRTFTNE